MDFQASTSMINAKTWIGVLGNLQRVWDQPIVGTRSGVMPNMALGGATMTEDQ